MRLKRFDLTRYGKFTDKQIDFGEKHASQPDFHIIYGPNEAGKSTLFSGLLDLFYGIGAQSPYNFIHPYNTMQLGGLIEFNGDTQEFIRIKRPNNSLLDAQGRPLPESAIRTDIGAIERDSYRTMFSLNDETLEQGGENILASKGDLGELLFSASAGLAQLSNKLTDLRGKADLFYKFRGRNSQLQALKSQLSELKAEREQFDVFAADFAQLVKDRDQTTYQYEEVNNERNKLRLAITKLEKQLNALPRLAALKRLRERLLPLRDLPQPPYDWTHEVQQLQSQDIELRVKLQSLTDEKERLTKQLDEIELDDEALHLSGRLEALEDLRARFLTAAKDLPERRLEMRELEAFLQALLHRLGQEDNKNPQDLVLSAHVMGQLRALIEARSGIEIALSAAETELKSTEQQARILSLQKTENENAFTGDATTMHELEALVVQLRSSDFQLRQQNFKETLFDLEASLQSRLQTLRPFAADSEQLAKMIVPDNAHVQLLKHQIATQKDQLKLCRQEITRLAERQAQLQSEKDALTLSEGLTEQSEVIAIRLKREEAWADHRKQLSDHSAEKFENILRQDDHVQTSRISQLSALTKLQQLTHEHKVTTDALQRAQGALHDAENDLNIQQTRVEALVANMSVQLVSYLDIDNLDDWLKRREQALDVYMQVQNIQRRLNAAFDDETQAIETLKLLLNRAGLHIADSANMRLPNLLAEAANLMERKNEWQKLKLAEAKLDEELQRRQDAVILARNSDLNWQEKWHLVSSSCWLAEKGNVPELAVVREVLPLMSELQSTLDKLSSLADRIDKMETDQKKFREEVQNLCVQTGFDGDRLEPLDIAYQLQQANKTAIHAEERRRKLTESYQDAERRVQDIVDAQAILNANKEQKLTFFGVDDLGAVLDKLALLRERFELQQHAEEAEVDIISMLGVENISDAEMQLQYVEREALEAERTELSGRNTDIDRRCQELYEAKNRAQDKIDAVGGDGRIAQIEEKRRTILLEIEEGARNYLQLRIGIAAAEAGLVAYRDKHRSSMMERASQAFSTISRGDYLGLTTQPGKDGEILIARAADGSSREAQELSKGTRFQLYLALRVAGYYEFVRERPALPFVADDIMESFDDFRAEETLRLFAQMAESGQVIYLTHHRHLCDIAQNICPTVSLHHIQ
ncbi:AAA family ATPase [Brucellaceae bacterium C25G]